LTRCRRAPELMLILHSKLGRSRSLEQNLRHRSSFSTGTTATEKKDARDQLLHVDSSDDRRSGMPRHRSAGASRRDVDACRPEHIPPCLPSL
jgi:hypothetical protein